MTVGFSGKVYKCNFIVKLTFTKVMSILVVKLTFCRQLGV